MAAPRPAFAPGPAFAPRRQPFEPRCTHLVMTRLYDSELVCELCRRPGPAGWLYRCVQDQEEFIEHLGISGKLMRAGMDDLSLNFIPQMGVRKGTAAARERPLSLLDELSPAQVAQFDSTQMGILLKQRENVRLVIQEEVLRLNRAIMMKHLSHQIPQGTNLSDMRQPWDGGSHQECYYLVCPRCRPACALRSSLSLNAVANGEIPPTAATGYGFHNTGGRPVVDARIVSNLGCRPVPLPSLPQSPTSKSNYTSRASSVNNTDPFTAQATSCEEYSSTSTSSTDSDSDEEEDLFLCWPGSPAPETQPAHGASAPSSPGRQRQRQRQHQHPSLNLNAEPAKAAPSAWTPPPSPHGSCASPAPRERAPAGMAPPLPNIEDVVRRGLGYRPRARVSVNEAARSEAAAGRRFTPSPLKVGHGVAMLEESVQLGVPDVITEM
ncbi:hypothetical protein ESCO_004396 [Escovopsis weberi]|uniref:Uncharacterized protein n=1 Tax=Escovopsis weberi TaxID=150374 RepID=A0A0M8MXM6_ESCWE|nr:hypothetical protein ESCO_004396 [Escovopsis weberi]